MPRNSTEQLGRELSPLVLSLCLPANDRTCKRNRHPSASATKEIDAPAGEARARSEPFVRLHAAQYQVHAVTHLILLDELVHRSDRIDRATRVAPPDAIELFAFAKTLKWTTSSDRLSQLG